MKISIQKNDLISIKFQGKINMKQEIMLSKNDAKKLGKLLTSGESTSFETE